jgi:hypothetical protein
VHKSAFMLGISLTVSTMVVSMSGAFAQGSSLPFGGGGRINAPAIIKEYNASGKQMRIEGSRTASETAPCQAGSDAGGVQCQASELPDFRRVCRRVRVPHCVGARHDY